ncbi:hypothetical protein GGS24DRAFT_347046 [Hypoxylon argillaceum]|nr:hypothetical protein GGS24DRAFT_347046 [Hypoxylon argillaceum]
MTLKRRSSGPIRRSKRLQAAKRCSSASPSEDHHSTSAHESLDSDTSSDINGDQLSILDAPETGSDAEAEECELHIYDSRYDTRGELILLRAGTHFRIDIPLPDSRHAGFVVIRHYSPSKILTKTNFEIRSPYATKAIRHVIKSYPGLAIGSKGKIVLDDQPRCLFHYRAELLEFAHSQSDKRFLQHVDYCLKYMNKVLSPQLNAFSTNVEHNTDQPGLQYEDLWMVFKPGTLLYQNDKFPRIAQLHHMGWVVQRSSPPPPFPQTIECYWILYSKGLCFNGKDFEIMNFTDRLEPYEGVKPFSRLDIFPLEYHERHAQIRQDSLDRAKLFISKAMGLRYYHYEGTGLIINQKKIDDRYEYRSEPTEINERIVLDEMLYSKYRRQNLREPPKSMTASTLLPADDLTALSRLKDDELRTCQVLIGGYVLGMEKWGEFHIDFIRDVNFSRYAFDTLALSLEKKSLITALVTSHKPPPTSANILMKKGRGLTFLLHGPPGVGKTFTADEEASWSKRRSPRSLITLQRASPTI